MLKELKNTTKHSFVYALGNIATKFIGIILIPLYTNINYFSHDEFGILAVLEASSQIIIGLLSMSMVQNLTRWYWDSKYTNQQKSIFFSSIAFLLATIIPIGTILSVFADRFSILLFQSSEYKFILQLTIISSCVQIVNNQIFCLAKLQSRSGLYSFVQITKLLITLIFTLLGILHFHLGLKAIWLSVLLGEFLTLLVLMPYLIKNSSFKIHFNVLKEMLAYGSPLMLAAISSVILATTDRYMLNSMSGLERTGVYSLGFRIANTLKVVITTSLTLAFSPLMMQYINKPNNQRFYSKTNTYTAFIFIVTLIGLSLFSLEIIKVFTKSKTYWEANYIIPIIAYSLFWGLLKDNILIGLIITKKTKMIGILIFITSLINICFNVILIPKFDIYGASVATLVSQIFFFISVTFFSQKSYPIKYEWGKIATLLVMSLVIILIGISIQDINTTIRLIIKIILFAIFPFLLYLFNFYEKVEIENIKSIFYNWKNPKKLKENLKRLIKG